MDKCSVLHFGYNNVRFDLELGGMPLVAHESERDLGMIVQSDLKVVSSVARQPTKPYGSLAWLRGFKNKTRAVMLPLYKAMVILHLDYSIQV